MADLFGSTEVLPAWLRDDGSRFNKAFALGSSVAQAQQENRRADAADRRAETQAVATGNLLKLQTEAKQLEVDDAKAFQADAQVLTDWGRSLLNAETDEEIAKAPIPAFKSAKALQTAEQIKDTARGKLAEKKLSRFGKDLEMNRMQAMFAKGALLTPEEDQAVFSKTHMEADPKGYLHGKQLLDQAQVRANAATVLQSQKDAAALDRTLARTESNEAIKFGDQVTRGLGGVAGVRAKEGVDRLASATKAAGIPVTPDEIDEAIGRAVTGGMSAVNAPQSVVKDLESENKSYQQLEAVTEKIAKFDSKFGKGAFDEYVGPVDAPVFRFKSKAVDPKKMSEADAEARKIFRDANYIIQGYRKNNFGTALTANETAAFREIVGDPSFADYANGLESFKENVKRGAAIGVADHKLAPNISVTIKKRFLEPGVGVVSETVKEPAVTQTVTVISPSGVRGTIPSAKLDAALKNGYKLAN